MHVAVMHVLVLASLTKGASDFKTFAAALVIGLVLLFVGLGIFRSDHRHIWGVVPLVIFVLLVGTNGGQTALRDLGTAFLNLINA